MRLLQWNYQSFTFFIISDARLNFSEVEDVKGGFLLLNWNLCFFWGRFFVNGRRFAKKDVKRAKFIRRLFWFFWRGLVSDCLIKAEEIDLSYLRVALELMFQRLWLAVWLQETEELVFSWNITFLSVWITGIWKTHVKAIKGECFKSWLRHHSRLLNHHFFFRGCWLFCRLHDLVCIKLTCKF